MTFNVTGVSGAIGTNLQITVAVAASSDNLASFEMLIIDRAGSESTLVCVADRTQTTNVRTNGGVTCVLDVRDSTGATTAHIADFSVPTSSVGQGIGPYVDVSTNGTFETRLQFVLTAPLTRLSNGLLDVSVSLYVLRLLQAPNYLYLTSRQKHRRWRAFIRLSLQALTLRLVARRCVQLLFGVMRAKSPV